MQLYHSAIHNSTKCNISLRQSLNQLVYLNWLNFTPSEEYQVYMSKKTLKLNTSKIHVGGSHFDGLNPLTSKSDWHLISHHNITPKSHIKVMRIKEMVTI